MIPVRDPWHVALALAEQMVAVLRDAPGQAGRAALDDALAWQARLQAMAPPGSAEHAGGGPIRDGRQQRMAWA